MIAFNPDSTTSWTIGYYPSLSRGGDYVAPTQNPYTALAAFWTATKAPFGLAMVDNLFNYQLAGTFHLMIDDVEIIRLDIASIAATPSEAKSPMTKSVVIAGICFETFLNNAEGGLADSGDPNRAMVLAMSWHQGTVATSVAAANAMGVELLNRCYVMDLTGTTRLSNVALSSLNDITSANYKAINGNPKHRAVEAKSSTVLKGTIKKKIAIEVMPYQDGRFYGQRLKYPASSSNILVKEHRAVALVWLEDKPPWPYPMETSELP
jgi:hypothetical protein